MVLQPVPVHSLLIFNLPTVYPSINFSTTTAHPQGCSTTAAAYGRPVGLCCTCGKYDRHLQKFFSLLTINESRRYVFVPLARQVPLLPSLTRAPFYKKKKKTGTTTLTTRQYGAISDHITRVVRITKKYYMQQHQRRGRKQKRESHEKKLPLVTGAVRSGHPPSSACLRGLHAMACLRRVGPVVLDVTARSSTLSPSEH